MCRQQRKLIHFIVMMIQKYLGNRLKILEKILNES